MEQDEPLPPGTVLGGQFTIADELGRGAFATVYAASDSTGESWALKVLHLERRPREVDRTRFRREAESAASIDHPAVVQVREYGEAEDGRPFIVYERLRGKDLAEVLEEGPMTPERIRALLVPCLIALQRAHAAGIVHRDLKPANLFVEAPGTAQERLRLLDFGVACFFDQPEARLTATGGILGTPRYMAPEYIEGKAVGPAQDVYSMGLILAELVTGRPVVQEENAYACMQAHVLGEIEVPDAVRAGPFGEVIARALSRKPDERPAIGDLLDGLGLPEVGHVAPPRRPAWLAVVVAAGLAVGALTAWTLREPPPDPPPTMVPTARVELDAAKRAPPDAAKPPPPEVSVKDAAVKDATPPDAAPKDAAPKPDLRRRVRKPPRRRPRPKPPVEKAAPEPPPDKPRGRMTAREIMEWKMKQRGGKAGP